MSDEELRRAMEFIVTSQAQSAERLARLERIVKLAVRAGLRTRRDVREQLAALVDAHIRLADAQVKTEAATRHTDERINALVGVMERHIGDGHGQGSPHP
jgi:hypothetical protein